MATKYLWERYLAKRDGRIDLSDYGFLNDPSNAWTGSGNQNLHKLPDLDQIPFAGILGEPGIGKTIIFADEPDRVRNAKADRRVLSLDLRSIGSDGLLYRKLFEAPEFLEWSAGDSELFIYLDSLDECLLRVDTVAALLATEFCARSWSRLFVRVACRTLAWPQRIIEQVLINKFGEDAVAVYEVAPLRRKDVMLAASIEGLDPYAFVAAVRDAQAVPLAIKPLTLSMLLKLFKKEKGLEGSQLELYDRGGLLLCENSESRRETRRIGNLNSRQRIALAERLASVTTLANRFAIWIAPDDGSVPDEDVPVGELLGSTERAGHDDVAVDQVNIMETLDTGLFSSRGPDRMGWAHQSYAEFLAARHLIKSGIPQETLLGMIRHPAGGLIPQLAGVAGWFASLNTQMRQALIRDHPDIIVRGDLGDLSTEGIAVLVDSLLRYFGMGKGFRHVVELSRYYRKLAHPGLADQLTTALSNRGTAIDVRIAAVMIAAECDLRAMEGVILGLALDQGEDPDVRAHAATALKRCGDAKVRAALVPLAAGRAGPDRDDQMKGAAMQTLWPGEIPITDLLSFVTLEANERFVGNYAYFLDYELTPHLDENTIVPALRWVQTMVGPLARGNHFHLRRLIDQILLKGLELGKDPQVLVVFGEVCATCLNSDHRFMSQGIGERENLNERLTRFGELRRSVLCATIPHIKYDQVYQLRDFSLVITDDFNWVCDTLSSSDPFVDEYEGVLIEIASLLMNRDIEEHFEKLYAAALSRPAIKDEMRWLFGPIELNSDVARLAKQRVTTQKQLMQERPQLNPPPEERILSRLAAIDAGDTDAWCNLNLQMTLKPHSTHYGSDFDYDLAETPGWKNSSPEIRQRILGSARRFLQEGELKTPEEDWNSHTFYRNDYAAYRALRLLKAEDPASYVQLGVDVWRKWLPIIIIISRNYRADSSHDQLVADANKAAGPRVIEIVRKLIEAEIVKGLSFVGPIQHEEFVQFQFLRNCDACWSDRGFISALTPVLEDARLTPTQLFILLKKFLPARSAPAEALAVELLAPRHLADPLLRRRSLLVSEALLEQSNERSWPAVWKLVEADAEFGIQLLERVCRGAHFGAAFYQHLTPQQLGELYVWIATKYPWPSEEGWDVRAVGPAFSIRMCRDGILTKLIHAGDLESVVVLRGLVQQIPSQPWLRTQLIEAEDRMRAKTWIPLAVQEVLKICRNPNGKFVTDERGLSEALLGALAEYQSALQGEQNLAQFLRPPLRGKKKGLFAPLDEAAISDHIRACLRSKLQDSGIVINREVEISHIPGAPIGHRTDIKVDAIRTVRGKGDILTAIVEVKGCWNRERNTAMRQQLLDDYMLRTGARVGFLVVGWFEKEGWDPEDHRRSDAPSGTMEDLRAKLDEQAKELSIGGVLLKAVVIDYQLTKSERRSAPVLPSGGPAKHKSAGARSKRPRRA